MTSALHVAAAGMVTAVGLDAPSALAAMRARLDGFTETRFVGSSGDWLVGAAVPLPKKNWIGATRMARLVARAIVEVLHDSTTDALVLCLPEEGRAGRPVRDAGRFARTVADLVNLPAGLTTRIVAAGRPSGLVALDSARRLLFDGAARSVVIAGVDSYLTGGAVQQYIAENRLLTPENSDGFIPGEAAAAILCRVDVGRLRLSGLGLSREEAHIYNC